MTEPRFTVDEVYDYCVKRQKYFNAIMTLELLDRKTKKLPYIEFGKDDACYTNHDKIHLGAAHFVNADDYDMLAAEVIYVIYHEVQHIKSTPRKPWLWGLNEGRRIVCMKISEAVEGPNKRRFLKDSDYENFIQTMKSTYNLHISLPAINKFVHFIINSNEDGREERIGASQNEDFRKKIILFRGRDWKRCEIEPVSVDKVDARLKLQIKLNQILSLATTSLYQKGFTDIYGNTYIEDEMQDILIHIRNSVQAPTCRQGVSASVEIIKLIANDIVEASKLTPLEQMLEELMTQFSDMSDYDGKERDEQTGSGMPIPGADGDSPSSGGAPFGVSQLGEEDDSGSSAGDGDEESSDSSDSSDGSDASSDGDSATDKKKNPSQNSKQSAGRALTLDAYSGHRNLGDTGSDVVDFDAVDKMIEDCMSEAANAAVGASAKADTYIKQTSSVTVKTTPVYDTAPATEPAEAIKGKYPYEVHFTELKRKYEVTDDLVEDIRWRASTFYRKISRFFQNLATPASRKQKHGCVDSRNLSELAMRGTDYYYRKAKNQKFSGCAYFLMDNSGSMGYGHNSKRYFCCNALSIIEEGFKKFMPLKIAAFDASGTNHVVHEVIKGWDERYGKNCTTNFLNKGRCGNGNKDGFSIRMATQELLARSERSKILFVLSDGAPSCYNNFSSGIADVEAAVQEARNLGIFVVGIFFSDYDDEAEKQQFVNMYHTNCICTTPDKIDEEVIKVMKSFMKTV